MRFLLAILVLSLFTGSVAIAEDLVVVTFEVTVPGNTPATDNLIVMGDVPQLGEWKTNEGGLVLYKLENGKYVARVKLPKDKKIEFKITRGSWETVEVKKDGTAVENRIFTPTKDETIQVTVEDWVDKTAKQ